MDTTEIYNTYLECEGVCTDTRSIKPDCLFVALKGDHFDGNDFALEALEKGAKYALVDDARFGGKKNNRIIKVKDCLASLQALAHQHRKQFDILIIGITGSNGKTTTKELVSTVLNEKYRVITTEGNLNNHIGVPLTLLRLTKNTEIAVIEMGANHLNDIKDLCEIAEPTHGIITNIGMAHLEGFGSKEGVAFAKSQLYIWVRDHGGTIFVNEKDRDLKELALKVNYEKSVNIVWYGNEEIPENDRLFGEFNRENVRAAYGIGLFFKVPVRQINHTLKTYVPKDMRGERKETKRGNELILDAYNANPSSMKAAIEAFSEIRTDKMRYLILGDMKELGLESEKEHKKIVDLIRLRRFTHVILVGEEFSKAAAKEKIFVPFKTTAECTSSFFISNIKRSLVLIKASNSMKLWELADNL